MSARATVALTVRLPEPLHRELTALAELKYASVNHEVVTAVRAHIDNATKRGNQ